MRFVSNNIHNSRQDSGFKAALGSERWLARVSAGVLLAVAASGCNQGAGTDNSVASSPATPVAAVTEGAIALEAAPPSAQALPKLSEFAEVWGPPLASDAPAIAATDHTGTQQTLSTLTGERGLLLVFSRSADW